MTPLQVSDIRFVAASAADRHRGLLGYLSFAVADMLRIDGATLRRTRDGRLVLSFPVRHDGHGRQHPIVRPVDSSARQAIEAQILDALRLAGANLQTEAS